MEGAPLGLVMALATVGLWALKWAPVIRSWPQGVQGALFAAGVAVLLYGAYRALEWVHRGWAVIQPDGSVVYPDQVVFNPGTVWERTEDRATPPQVFKAAALTASSGALSRVDPLPKAIRIVWPIWRSTRPP